MPDTGDEVVAEAVHDFRSSLCSALPFNRLSQFHEDSVIKDLAQLERRRILEDFMRKVSDQKGDRIGELIMKLDASLTQLVTQFITKNQEHRQHSETILQQICNFLLLEYESAVNLVLDKDPQMELDSLETVHDCEKGVVLGHFLNHWKPGNEGFHQKFERMLESDIDTCYKVLRERQRKVLEGPAEEERRLLEEAKENLLRKCDQLMSDMASGSGSGSGALQFKTEVSKDLFKRKMNKARGLLKVPEVSLADLRTELEQLEKTASKHLRGK